MKKTTIPCDFGPNKVPFPLYIGEPTPGVHPLKYQDAWMRAMRGGQVPIAVMEAFAKLQGIAAENNVPYEELVTYALGQAEAAQSPQAEGAGREGRIAFEDDAA